METQQQLMFSNPNWGQTCRILVAAAAWLLAHSVPNVDVFMPYFSPCWPTVGTLMLSWTILINIENVYAQIKSECCWPSRLLQAHLSVAVRLHQFDEWCVPLDLELNDWSILTRNLQVYVFVAFRLDRFLAGKKINKSEVEKWFARKLILHDLQRTNMHVFFPM